MTPKATATACRAILRCTLAGRPAVRARKIGVIPGGSIITKRVRKRDPKTAMSNTVSLAGEEGPNRRMRAGTPRGARGHGDVTEGRRGAETGKRRGALREARHTGSGPPAPGTGNAPVARRVISP